MADTAVSGERGFVPLPRGTAVGRYLLLDLVGEGGMGAVYAGYDPDLHRKVALKLLKVDPEGAEAARARLLREAQAMARLSHPNVVAVHDAGVYGEQLFVAMELVEGQTLTAWLREASLSRREVVAAFVAAGEGLAAAHAAGIVHRDFKPDNVLVDRGGRIRVTDFGLAHAEIREEVTVGRAAASQASLGIDLTVAGRVAGTPAYMSPEQFLGADTDARTDQFSFCAALFEALAGVLPFEGQDFAGLRASVLSGPPRLSALPGRVPAHLRKALARGMARRPEDRFASMEELLRVLRHDPIAQLRRWALWGVPIAALAGAGAIAGLYEHGQRTRCAREAREAVQEAWGTSEQERVRENLSRAGLEPGAVKAVLVAVNDHAEAWAEAQRQACEARRAGVEGESVLRCLQRCARVREAVIRRLASTTEGIAESAGRLLQRLHPPAQCVAAQARRAPDPAVGAGLQAEVEELQIALELGQFAQVRERAEALLARARQAGAPVIVAQVYELQGIAAYNQAEGEVALAYYRQASREADRAGDDETSLQVRARMVDVYSNLLFRGPEAQQAALDAEAWLGRLGGPPRQALTVAKAFCSAESMQQHWAQALEHCARVVELSREVFGAESASTAASLNEYSAVLELAGQRARAIAELQKSIAIYEKDPFSQAIDLAGVWGNLAIMLANQGRSDEALKAVERAAVFVARLGGQAHSYEAWLGLTRGETLEDQGDWEGAARAYAHALQVFAGDEVVTRAEILAGQARVLVRRGRAVEALPLAREAVQVAQDHPDPYPRMFCQMALAQALWATGQDRPGALELARTVLATLQGPEDGFRRGQVEAWLKGKDEPSAGR